jgi:ankyrin repeat protein
MRKIGDILKAVYRKDYGALGATTREELNGTDADGRTPLMHAVLEGDPDLVRFLIDRGVDVNAADHGQKWTALHFAARDQNTPVVRLLLDAGAAVDPDDAFGNTPLWRSVMQADLNLETVRELLRHGADVRKKNNYGEAPVDVARKRGRKDLMNVLEKTN